MARRVPRRGLLAAGLALALAGGTAAAAEPRAPERVEAAEEPLFSVLAHHDFDGARADTGPDTFRVWETTRGRVERSTLFRWSGDVAVEIRDAAGDGDFPELQGYFPKRATGRLFVHFALLVTDPAEPFNVALAGPGHFALRRDGIAFWLQGREGVLRHVSDSIPKPLLALAPFTWYQVGPAMMSMSPSRSVRHTSTPWFARRVRVEAAGWPYALFAPTEITAVSGAISATSASDDDVDDPWWWTL